MITPMIRTPQLAFVVACACGQNRHSGINDYQTAVRERDRLAESLGYGCGCQGNAWTVDWYARWAVDPIATVRQVHPYAYCRPPVGPGFAWAVMEHAAAPWGPVIAEGPTEAAAWLAAAERVCG